MKPWKVVLLTLAGVAIAVFVLVAAGLFIINAKLT